MWRTLARASLIASVAAVTAVLPVSVASASTPQEPWDCPDASLCGWSEAGFMGKVTTFRPGGGCFDSPFPLRSVANTFGGGVGYPVVLLVYSGQNCTGKPLGSVTRGQALPSLPADGLSVMSAW
ncbi:peptidase inhibitor family I36 protein [Spirillospora sp. NPDC048824]|uniref:peptidase inhibitor family I36 protein n=1 Tax=Spirillospora sp. NPDC048824 TaxID=3364526 RepID=UPI0037120768